LINNRERVVSGIGQFDAQPAYRFVAPAMLEPAEPF
jgi:hypothetical protein